MEEEEEEEEELARKTKKKAAVEVRGVSDLKETKNSAL